MAKKLGIALGVFVGLILLVIVLVPVFFDADKFRPQIIKAVEDNTNADLELGKIKLSLWGGLHLELDKLILSEKGSAGRRPIFSMNNARLEIPLLSVLGGRPDITLAVAQPEITVIVGEDGKMNVMKIAKPAEGAQAAPQQPEKKSGGGGAVAPFDFSVHITNGQVIYADSKKGTKTKITGLDFDLRKLALNKPFGFSLKSDLNVNEMKDLVLKGALKLEGTAGVYMGSSGFERADLDTEVDLGGLTIKYGKLMNKTDKDPLKIAVDFSTTDKAFNLKKGHVQILDAAVDASGKVDNFDAPVLDLSVKSTKFVFESWHSVLGVLKDFDMKGAADFNLKVTGPTSKLNINGSAALVNVSLKAPGIVPRVTDVNAKLNFDTDSASVPNASLKMGASDLSMSGSVKNFNKPVIALNVKSTLMDVDSILPQKTAEQVKAEESKAKAEAASGGAKPMSDAEIEASVGGPIAQMKKNPYARNTSFVGHVDMKKIVAHKAELTNFAAELTWQDLVMTLKSASANAFGGSMKFNSAIDFRGTDPIYMVGGEVAGLDVNSAITSQMPPMKDNLFGKIFSKFTVAGSGVTKAKAKATMKGTGNFKLENGQWSALKVLQMVGEKLSSIPGAKDKLGGVKVSGKFRQMKSDFNISGGRFNIVNLVGDMEEANTGLNGNGYVDFDMNLSLIGKIFAPAGGDVPAELRAPDGRAAIPYEIGGLATSPSFKYEVTAKAVGGAYLKKEAGAAVKKAVENINAPPAVKDLLKKLPF